MRRVPDHEPREEVSDDALLLLFRDDPQRAWDLFLRRYADPIFRHIQRLGFDYDDAMDRFTYVCEKLSEKNFRRMRTVRHTGRDGELTPWIRTVVERLCISWLWSVEGRERMFRSLESLPSGDRRVFELHFRHGLTPLAIHEQLRIETQTDLATADVFDALERIFARLSPNRLWRLISHLARARGTLSLNHVASDDGEDFVHDLPDPSLTPEEALLAKEEGARARRQFETLSIEERLILRMRYDDALEIPAIAKLLGAGEQEVRGRLRAALASLRKAGGPGDLSVAARREPNRDAATS